MSTALVPTLAPIHKSGKASSDRPVPIAIATLLVLLLVVAIIQLSFTLQMHFQ